MTKTNLTLLTIGLVAASLLASCKKNDNGGTADGQGFKASIEQSSDSRTHGEVGVNDNVVNVKWTAADQILVANNADNASASTTLTYELTEGENTADGTFYTGQPHDDFFNPNYAAIYPSINPDGTANSLSRTTATFNLPATQTYSGSNVFAEKVVPMVAYSTSQTLQFKNACGGLRFPMVGSNVTVQRVELTTTTFNTNDHLCGVFTVDCSSTNPTLAWQSGGGNTITIDCGSGITLGTSEAYFYFMLPPGTLHGLSLTAYDGSNNVVYNVESNREYVIERNKIKKVGANLEIPLEVTTASPTYITTTSAKGGVSVANGTATETGICWGTSNTPDINGFHATGTTAIDMISLTPNTVYYVRAYAKSANNTVYYGDAIPFASRANFTNGKLPGAFHTAANEVCYFSMGNLQCKANYNTSQDWQTNWTNGNVVFRYAENQFDYVGGGGSTASEGTVYNPDGSLSKNNEKNAHNNKWFDVFSWGTSGYLHNNGTWTYGGNTYNYQYYPWVKPGGEIPNIGNSVENQCLWAYRNNGYDLNSSTKQADWGYNKIQNGLNAEGIDNKFTPSNAQMRYLLHTRTAPTLNGVANARFAFTKLIVKNDKEVRGLMLFPDSYTWPSQVAQPKYINQIGQGANPYFGDGTAGQWELIDFSSYTEAEWTLLEKAGMVFLPCGGCWGVSGHADEWVNRGGRYWTSSHCNDYQAYEFGFSPDPLGTGFNVNTGGQQRKFGFCVRLLIK